MKSITPFRAMLATDSWAGRREYTVEIVAESKSRYAALALEEMLLPGRHRVTRGEIFVVPKSAVRKLPLSRAGK